MTTERVVYRRWVVANGWAEAAGLGTTFAIGTTLAPQLDEITGASAVLGALAAVLLGIFLEGVVVGLAQERVLGPHLPNLYPRAWTFATAVGAGLAWLVGMVPSTAIALTQVPSDVPPPEPGPSCSMPWPVHSEP